MEQIELKAHHKEFLSEIKESEWYKDRPQCIKQAIEIRPPVMLYSLNEKGCSILSYEEPESGRVEDVTVTVQKNGLVEGESFGPAYNQAIHTNRVFGVKLEDLKPFDWTKMPPPKN